MTNTEIPVSDGVYQLPDNSTLVLSATINSGTDTGGADTGTAGTDGANGTDGTDGANGANGASAYDIAVANGFVGSAQDWLDSLVGSSGSGSGSGGVTESNLNSYRSDTTATCVVPTYDNNPHVTHNSVVHTPDMWNGYPYWMAFTPYPKDARENPSVVASHDGINWEVPSGLTNPIVGQQFAIDALASVGGDSKSYNSDTDMSRVGNAMWLYWRVSGSSVGVEQIYRTTSTDGVTWSTPVKVLETTGPLPTMRIISPSVEAEADGTYSMWSVIRTAIVENHNVYDIERRTSADGLTWSAPTTCTRPEIYESGGTRGVWHLEITRVGNRYYMLGVTDLGRMIYWYSDDGLEFKGSSAPAISMVDGMQWYRGSMVARPGNVSSPRWDLWIPDRDDTSRRIHHFTDVDMGIGEPALRNPRGYWLPANSFEAQTGNPDYMTIMNRWKVWALDSSAFESVNTTCFLPESWGGIRATAYWTVYGKETGGIVLNCGFAQLVPGASIDPAPNTKGLGPRAVSSLGQRVVVETQFGSSGRGGWTGGLTAITVERLTSRAGDTLPGDAHFIGIFIEPAP